MAGTPSTPAVECWGIVKDFPIGERFARVLRGIDLTVPYGGLTLLVGPSGSGKTTLLSIIAGILSPTSGEVAIAGLALARISDRERTAFRRAHIGSVSYTHLTLPTICSV